MTSGPVTCGAEKLQDLYLILTIFYILLYIIYLSILIL